MLHKVFIAAYVAGFGSFVACASGTTVRSEPGEVASVSPVTADFIPAGTMMNARFDQSISTSNHEGDRFAVTVTSPVYAQNGSVAIPVGAVLTGVVTGVHSAKVPGERNVIRLNVDQLHMNNRAYPFSGNISNVTVENASGASNRTIRNTVIGGAVGTALGAIVTGGEAAGLITGGILGAGAGAIISLGNGSNEPATIPAGSSVTIQATQGLPIR
jgi:hypothetical protein